MVSRNARYRASNLPASSNTSLLRVWPAHTCCNQLAQTAVDVRAPRVRARIETLDARHQTLMREAELGLVLLSVNLEHDVGAVPLALVFDEIDVAVDDMPHNPLARHPFGDPLSGVMDVFVAVRELGAEHVGSALNLS